MPYRRACYAAALSFLRIMFAIAPNGEILNSSAPNISSGNFSREGAFHAVNVGTPTHPRLLAAGALSPTQAEDAMKKLRLNLERLEVQSFETERPDGNHGTVQGLEGTYREMTCDGTCDQTCGAPASCVGAGEYCGTYPEHGCPNSIWYCTDAQWVC